MSIAKVKLDETTKLEFGVSITGAEGTPEARFVIEGSKYSLSYPCHKLDEGGIQVIIEELGHILKAGEYPVRLEVIIEGKIFVPMEDTIVFDPNVEVTSKPAAIKQVKEAVQVDNVVVTVDNAKEIEAKNTKLALLIAEAFDHAPDAEDAAGIINESLVNRKGRMPKEKKDLVMNMLKTAKEQGIEFDHNLLSNKR